MKLLFAAAVCGVVVTSLSGCASTAPPPLTLACTTHTLPSGLIRAKVTIRTTTGAALRAVVYGPALTNTRFIQPRYSPTTVYVEVGGQRRSYVGFVIPSVGTKRPGHVLFRLARLQHPQSILASPHTVVHAGSWDAVRNPDCTVK